MWSVTSKKVYKLQEFENKVFKKVFEAKKDELFFARIEMSIGK
jgi:hypothetical protein